MGADIQPTDDGMIIHGGKPLHLSLIHIYTAVNYLVIIGFSEVFMSIELMTVGALSGLGRTRLSSTISAVSYTHLDVYKRQRMYHVFSPFF